MLNPIHLASDSHLPEQSLIIPPSLSLKSLEGFPRINSYPVVFSKWSCPELQRFSGTIRPPRWGLAEYKSAKNRHQIVLHIFEDFSTRLRFFCCFDSVFGCCDSTLSLTQFWFNFCDFETRSVWFWINLEKQFQFCNGKI